MTRRDWWFGIALVTAAILVHALVPRYEWRTLEYLQTMRIDRWTGRADVMRIYQGRYYTETQLTPPDPIADARKLLKDMNVEAPAPNK